MSNPKMVTFDARGGTNIYSERIDTKPTGFPIGRDRVTNVLRKARQFEAEFSLKPGSKLVARVLKRKVDRNGESVGEDVSRLKGDPALIVSGELTLYACPKNFELMVSHCRSDLVV
jgi:hypothetical protein